jgi:DNA-binding NarL/FixJ family response regulator
MIRLLIVDEQKSIQESLKFLLAKEKEIKIVATASNGKVAVEKVKELHPDIVLMDLSMPIMDGATAIQIISERYPQTRILVLTNSNQSQSLNQALVAGAKGYLLKTAPIEDIITALHAVHRGCVYFGPHVWQTPTFFSVSSLKSQSQLKSLTSKIAQEVIIYWRTQSEQKPTSATDILIFLKLINNQPEQTISLIFNSQAKDKLLVQLKLQIKKIKVSCQKENHKRITQKLEQLVPQMMQEVEKDFVSNEYHNLTSNYLFDFQVSAYDFRNQTIQKYQKYLSDYLQVTAPQNSLNCLEDLKCILNQLHQQYQNQQKQYLTKSDAAWRTYLYLLEKIEKDYSLSKSSKKNYASNDWSAICNALYYVCEDKVNAKIYGWESELISELLEQTQIYLNNLRQTDDLLNELQEYFEQLHSSPIPISSSYIREKTDPVQLRTSIETLSGHSLNQWGTSANISAPIIRKHLLAELNPIAKSIYTQFYQEAFSFIQTNNLIDDN